MICLVKELHSVSCMPHLHLAVRTRLTNIFFKPLIRTIGTLVVPVILINNTDTLTEVWCFPKLQVACHFIFSVFCANGNA